MLENSLMQGKTHRMCTWAYKGHEKLWILPPQGWLSCFCCPLLLGQRILFLQKALGKANSWALTHSFRHSQVQATSQPALPLWRCFLKQWSGGSKNPFFSKGSSSLAHHSEMPGQKERAADLEKPGNQHLQHCSKRGSSESWQISSPQDTGPIVLFFFLPNTIKSGKNPWWTIKVNIIKAWMLSEKSLRNC